METEFSELLTRLTDYDLVIIIEFGPEKFYGLIKEEAYRRMGKREVEDLPTRKEIPEKIAELQKGLVRPSKPARKKRQFSAEALKKMSEATKNRWKKYRADKKALAALPAVIRPSRPKKKAARKTSRRK